eukprot:1141621-Heterocapsa_arctica.AAC.1
MGEPTTTGGPVVVAGSTGGDGFAHLRPADRHSIEPITRVGRQTFVVAAFAGHVACAGELITPPCGRTLCGLTLTPATAL